MKSTLTTIPCLFGKSSAVALDGVRGFLTAVEIITFPASWLFEKFDPSQIVVLDNFTISPKSTVDGDIVHTYRFYASG